MRRLLLISILVFLPISENSIVNQHFTSYEISRMTDIYYQFCPSNKCDNTTHVPEVTISKPNMTVCCYPQCSCETATCRNGALKSNCCPEELNALTFVPPIIDKCINAQLKPWNPKLTRPKPVYEAYLMTSSCNLPRMPRDDIAQKCESGVRFNDLDTKVPVADSSFTVTFANRYCAECSKVDYVPWIPMIHCTESTFDVSPIESIVERVQESEVCTLFFDPPDGQNFDNLHSCGRYISECNMTGNWGTYDPILESGCKAMYVPFQFLYKNIFCYLCNSDGSLTDMPACRMDSITQITFALELTYPITYNVMNSEMNSTSCGRYGLYDPFQDSCLEIKCLLHKVYVGDGLCERTVERMGGMNFQVFLKFTPQEDILAEPSVTNPLFTQLEQYVVDMFQEVAIATPHLILAPALITGSVVRSLLVYFVLRLPVYSWTGLVQMSSIESLLKYHGGNMSLTGLENEQIPFLIELDTIDSVIEADDWLLPEFTKNYDTLLSVHDCPHVELNLSVYSVTNGRLGVWNETFSVAIGRNEYLTTISGESILTCLDTYELLSKEFVPACASSLKFIYSLCFLSFILHLISF